MNTLIIDKKKYVVVEQGEYNKLLEKAASKRPSTRKLSLEQGKKLPTSSLMIGTKKSNHPGQSS